MSQSSGTFVRHGGWPLLGTSLGLLALTAAGAASDDEVIYSRVDVVEASTGQVELRRNYTRQLRLPLPDCREGRFVCLEDAIYGQVYELSFNAETSTRQPSGASAVVRVDRGRLLVALDLSKDDEVAFESAWRAEIAALHPVSFDVPQAELGYRKGALSQSLVVRSAKPAWVCAELEGAANCDVVAVRAEGQYSVHGTGIKVAERAVPTIGRALTDVKAEIHRTAADVREQERIEVRFGEALTLAGRSWSDALVQLPEGASLSKRPLDGKLTGGARDMRGDVHRGHEGRHGGIERDALMPPASIELLAKPMWATAWRFERTREIFGEASLVRHAPPIGIVVGVAPIADPMMDDLSRNRTPLAVPAERLIAGVLARFLRSAVLDPILVRQAFEDPELWPPDGDWLVVSCEEDGTAHYGIAPFATRARVTNPREACAAIRRELE